MQKPIRAITSVVTSNAEVINGFVWRMGMFLVFFGINTQNEKKQFCHIRLASDFYVSSKSICHIRLAPDFINESSIGLELDRLGEIWAD